jgi:hypothetical protein
MLFVCSFVDAFTGEAKGGFLASQLYLLIETFNATGQSFITFYSAAEWVGMQNTVAVPQLTLFQNYFNVSNPLFGMLMDTNVTLFIYYYFVFFIFFSLFLRHI